MELEETEVACMRTGIEATEDHRGDARTNALETARRKLDHGCIACAEGYLQLAARHGATRRDFVLFGLEAVAATALAGGAMAATNLARPTKAEALGFCFPEDAICRFGFWEVPVVCCFIICAIDFFEWTGHPC